LSGDDHPWYVQQALEELTVLGRQASPRYVFPFPWWGKAEGRGGDNPRAQALRTADGMGIASSQGRSRPSGTAPRATPHRRAWRQKGRPGEKNIAFPDAEKPPMSSTPHGLPAAARPRRPLAVCWHSARKPRRYPLTCLGVVPEGAGWAHAVGRSNRTNERQVSQAHGRFDNNVESGFWTCTKFLSLFLAGGGGGS
jgi:hypothetical protein